MKTLLDSGWKFFRGEVPNQTPEGHGPTYLYAKAGAASGAADPKFDDRGWRAVDLPHDWVVEGRVSPQGNVSQGFLLRGVGWYRKTFTLPPAAEGKKVWLEFDAVGRNSTFWLNGFRLGNHASGYTGFRCDISDFAVFKGGENKLAVKVDGTEMEGWWYEGCGIYRHVWLDVKEKLHLEYQGFFVCTPKVTAQAAEIRFDVPVENEADRSWDIEIHTGVFDASGRKTVVAETAGRIAAGSRKAFKQTARISSPRLWSPDNPYLYRVVTEIRQGKKVIDREETKLGVRWFGFDADKGFFLNGKPVKLKGTCNHQDFAGVGVALPDRLHVKKIELLKEMGCNAYRCSHNPPARELLDACDRLGMLVMDENRKLDSSAEGLADLRWLIRRDRNHPSVILWSLENEETLEGTEAGARVLRTLYRVAKEEDPTRPVTAAISHDWNGAGYADGLDVAGYNYNHKIYVSEHQAHPERKMFGSETTSAFETRGVYRTGDGYCAAYDTDAAQWGATHQAAWKAVAENQFMAGLFIWTGFDYRGEPTPYQWPNISTQFGIMDSCGFPKDAYYYYRAWWTSEPALHILPHWNWPGREGRVIPVWCYSNCASVELFRNGTSLGRKEMAGNGYLEWPVPYEPGELTAVGFKPGCEALRASIKTTGAPARIVLAPDRQTLSAGGQDVACVTVTVTDKDGLVVPDADNMLNFRVAGAGKLLGLGNGDPKDQGCDKDSRRRVFHGFCLAIIQAGCEAGEVVLQAESGALPAASVTIKVV